MKIWVRKTSEELKNGKVIEYKDIKDCIEAFVEEEDDELIVYKVPNYFPDEAKQCEYCAEIYDTWRE